MAEVMQRASFGYTPMETRQLVGSLVGQYEMSRQQCWVLNELRSERLAHEETRGKLEEAHAEALAELQKERDAHRRTKLLLAAATGKLEVMGSHRHREI